MNERTVVYPAFITPDEEGNYLVSIPDMGIDTFGKSFEDAIYMARDAIGVMSIEMEDNGEALPERDIVAFEDAKDNTIKTYVDVDLFEYRRKVDSRTVRKNVSIPYYLNVEVEKLGLSCSKLLQDAILAKIHC